MQFLDEVKIYVKSGNGGNGSVSFRREKFIERGGPDGGNGGRGGDIIIECSDGLNTLVDFRYKQHFKAQNGKGGMGRNRTGMAGEDLILKVPTGTQIFAEDKETIIADLTEIGDQYILLKGGQGGIGNCHFKSSTNRSPRQFTEGKLGDEIWIWMQLKLISDAGLVGLPNAGKSTFLATTSSAKPKIADYPFTTLKPQLGVVYIDEYEFVLADIPGLIEGAHEGIGLGDKFLKHVERCGVLLHLIDINGENITKSYKIIRNELDKYGLKDKKEIVALTKIDTLDEKEIIKRQKKIEKAIGKKTHLLSSINNSGVKEVLRELRTSIENFRLEEKGLFEETFW